MGKWYISVLLGFTTEKLRASVQNSFLPTQVNPKMAPCRLGRCVYSHTPLLA